MRNKKLYFVIIFMLMLFPFLVDASSVKFGRDSIEVKCVGDAKQASYQDGKAILDCETNTLTLNGFNGADLLYEGGNTLTIVLVGENTIYADYYMPTVTINNSSLIIKGDGVLNVNGDTENISINNGSLTISDKAIVKINNVAESDGTGINIQDGSLTMNDATLNIDGTPDYGIQVKNGNVSVLGESILNIKIPAEGINVNNGDVTVDDGNITLETEGTGINTLSKFLLLDGNVDIKLLELDQITKARYGIIVGDSINVNGGKLHVVVPENETAVVAFTTPSAPGIVVKEGLSILPEGNIIFENSFGSFGTGVTIGLDNKVANEITIKEVKTYTYEVLEGAEVKFDKGKLDSLVIKIDGDYSLFKEFALEGVTLVKDTDYTVNEGSTIITLTNSGLAKLNNINKGEYKYTVKYTNNKEVIGKLIVNQVDVKPKEEKKEENPNTLDNILIYLVVGGLSLSTLVGYSLYSKYKYNK